MTKNIQDSGPDIELSPYQQLRRRSTALIDMERDRQDVLWGTPKSRINEPWLAILTEEVGEVARATLKNPGENVDLKKELIHVAAVAKAWLERLLYEEDR